MNEKIISVYFDRNGLPYKDRELTCHFPIIGSGFLGASNTTKIRFYFENIGTLNDTYLAVSKLPNGKQGSQLLNIKSSDENGQYAELSLSEWYFQAKGDVFIGLKVYRGGVDVTVDDETGFSIVSGDPVIMVTGSIKLAINYAPIGDVPDYRDEFTAYNDILALMGDKPDIDTVPLLVNFSDYATWGALYEYVGTRPFVAYVNGVLSVCAIESEDDTYKLLVNNSTGIFRTSTFALDSAISISLDEIELKTDNCVVLTGTSGTLTSEQLALLSKANAYIRIDSTYYHKMSADTFLHIGLVEYTDYVTLFTGTIVIDASSNPYTWTQTNKSTNIYKKEKVDSLVSGLETKINASGHSLSATIDNQTYVMTIALKDKNNNVISTQQIDLPLESIVTSATYYDEYSYGGVDYEKVIVITLATTDIPTIAPVGDLIQGLVSESQLSVILEDYALKSNTYTKTEVDSALGNKQNTLVSGQNIKTINGQSILGSGDLPISGGGSAEWGDIVGDITEQTDLQNELQDIREVAEGKCKTYALSYTEEEPTENTFVANRFERVDGTKIETWQDFVDYVTPAGLSLLFSNARFNSQNDVLYGVGYFVSLNNVVVRIIDLKEGDIILVVELDVPDRWNQAGGLYKLETSKVDLTNYATKTEVNAKSDLTNVAPTYDSTLTYTIGEVVSYNGKVYKCTTAITQAEEWDASHWTETNVASDFVNLTGTQVIGGNKNFINKIVAPQIEQSAGTLEIGKTGNLIKINGSFAPDIDDYREIGDSSHRYKKLYLSGTINPNNSNYGLSLPSTASLTANKEIATTDELSFPLINAPTSTTLTDEQITQIISKGAIIVGNISGWGNWQKYILFPCGEQYSGRYFGYCILTRNGYSHVEQYSINLVNKTIGSYGDKYIDIDSSRNISIVGLNSVNNISINQFYKKPQSSVSLSDGGTITDSTLKSLIQNEQPIKLNGFTCYFSCDDGTNYQYVSTRYDSSANKNHINVITINKSTWVATFHTSDIAV